MFVFKRHLRLLARVWMRFQRDRRGDVAIIFALALIPILACVGAAVDYSRANALKADLQAAVDSTALMVSKNAASQTASALQTSAQTYFNTLFNNTQGLNPQVTASYSNTGGSSVAVNATADMPTTFIAILGFKTLTITGSSTSKWGSTRLRVALVLDNTGSMADSGKIDALKTATKNLLTQLQAAATTNGDVYVSIVPFSKDINLGASNYNGSWIDWTDWESAPAIMATWIANNQTTWEQTGPGDACPLTNSSHGFVCAPSPTSTSTTSTIPASGTYSGYICPGTDTGGKTSAKNGIMYNGCYNSVQASRTISSGWSASCGSAVSCSCSGNSSSRRCTQTYFTHTWRATGTAAAPSHSTWNGCVADRGNSAGPVSDYDRLVTAPTTSISATLFPAEQYAYCSIAVSGLSYDWTGMASLVDSLSPNGATSQPIGLVWGWQSLVGGGPLSSPTMSSSYTYQQVIILLSDGLNTQDRWYGNGSSVSSSVDARMYDSSGNGTCANIKGAGITIYAIQVNTGGDPTSTLLQNCASSSDKFFLLTSANQILTTFNTIGTNLTKLRIAR
jgi:Flp pilus assembly protein TadG